MAFDYSKTSKTANRLVKNFGQALTLTHVVAGTYVPGAGITNTTTTQYGYGAIVNWDSRQIDGSLILATDKKLLLSPLNTAGTALTAPVLEDKVTDAAGKVYTIVAPLNTMNPAGTAVLYEVNLRG